MQSKQATIIIPTFNEEKCIIACLDSMLEQSYKNLELIVVDDGSTDNTLFLLDEIQRTNPQIIILKQRHQGPAKARNLASKVAKGEILVFMDADMTFDKDFIKELTLPIIEQKYKGTFSKEEYVQNWGNVWARCWNINLGLGGRRIIPENHPDQGLDFRAIERDEFLKVGGFDDTGYTDTWTLGKKLGYFPQAVKGAKYFHNNPDTLKEVFLQSKWVSKRSYKLGMIGLVVALIRRSLPLSLIIGFFRVLQRGEPRFVIFKIVSDFGAFLGILEMTQGKLAK